MQAFLEIHWIHMVSQSSMHVKVFRLDCQSLLDVKLITGIVKSEVEVL